MKTQKIVKFVNKLNVKFVVVKVNGNWVKTCQEVQWITVWRTWRRTVAWRIYPDDAGGKELPVV